MKAFFITLFLAIAMLINAWLFIWYNYIWLQSPLVTFGTACILALATMLITFLTDKVGQVIVTVFLFISFFAQVLNWIGIIAFPIFNLQ